MVLYYLIQIKIKFVVIGGKETAIAHEEAGNTNGKLPATLEGPRLKHRQKN
jgi:hypothetical protein